MRHLRDLKHRELTPGTMSSRWKVPLLLISLPRSTRWKVPLLLFALLLTGAALPLARLAPAPLLASAAPVPSSASALRHEVPATATALVFLRPEGRTMRMLVRVPVEAMRDIQWPLRDLQYMVISESDFHIRNAATLWVAHYVKLYENGELLAGERIAGVRISLPSDRSFTTYESALANLNAPAVPDSVLLPWKQGLIDVLFEYPISSAESDFAMEPELAHLGVKTTTVLRFLPATGGERVLQYTGNPGRINLDPSWVQSALLFVKLGFQHILEGTDHILFLLCLVIPFRQVRQLIVIVTSFTVAHSITLIASAREIAPTDLWFTPLIETLIALSIVFMALENIAGAKLNKRWLIVFVFGLVHGFGFSFFLKESLQFAGAHLGASLFAFNVGVELGQLLVILIAAPVLSLLFRHVVAERMGIIILSALVAHTAWHWMTERGAELLAHDIAWPVMDAAFLLVLMRWMMLLLILVGIVALMAPLFGRLAAAGEKKEV